MGDLGLIPGLGRFPGGGHGNPLQCSYLENLHGQRSLVSCNPWGGKELETFNNASICNCWSFNPVINPVDSQVIALCFNPVESHRG